MISPPEARHEIVLASISVRDIKPPLLWQLIFPEIDSNKISPPIVEPETEPLKFLNLFYLRKNVLLNYPYYLNSYGSSISSRIYFTVRINN